MIVIVCGGRNFGNKEVSENWREEYQFVLKEMTRRIPVPDPWNNVEDWPTIVTGGAPGVDTIAIDWAVVNWTMFEEFKADWDEYGKAAGPIRNQKMLDEMNVDLVLAFPGGKGTADMVRRAKEADVKVEEIEYVPTRTNHPSGLRPSGRDDDPMVNETESGSVSE